MEPPLTYTQRKKEAIRNYIVIDMEAPLTHTQRKKEAIRNYIVIDTCSEKMAPDNQNGPFPIPLPLIGSSQL